jgi:branched-chain amino acid transport system substrate-binding protein
MPYSGPASAYGSIGRVELAYFKMINEHGGVKGRKINLISIDDGYSPARTVEQARRLVEEEQVAFLFGCLGTPTNLAIRQYCNEKHVPQLSCATGASAFDDPRHYPWTTPANPIYETEARIYGKYVLSKKPDAKIAILYQNDGFGQDYLSGLRAALGPERASMIVKQASYEVTEPTVDSQVTALQGSGADVFVIAATPKFAAQAIRKSFDLGWGALRIVSYVSLSVAAVMKPAGLEKSKGVITAFVQKDPTDPRWKDDPNMKMWGDFVEHYLSPAQYTDGFAYAGFGYAYPLVGILERCGDDLSRENILKQSTNIKGLDVPTLIPGIHIDISPDSYRPYHKMQLAEFDGQSWRLFGDLIDA